MTTDLPFPSAPGTYVLAMTLERRTEVAVGALGRITFAPGLYLYVGSALGPGGIAARLSHHLRAGARAHWHLDHLRRSTRPVAAWICETGRRLECTWSGRLERLDGLSQGPPRFGASGCACRSHLYHALDAGPAVMVAVDGALHPARRVPVSRPGEITNCVT